MVRMTFFKKSSPMKSFSLLFALFLFLLIILGIGLDWFIFHHDTVGEQSIEANVEFPLRLDLSRHYPLKVSVRNKSAKVLPLVTVIFDPQYFNKFSHVFIDPSSIYSVIQGLQVQLLNLLPGETQWIVVNLKGKDPGLCVGKIKILLGSKEDENETIFDLETLLANSNRR